jgi:predicted RNA binding protein YcfA (HicA-like mRNA interferase family)
MPKMPPAKPRVVIQFLERNGFVLDHTSGSHYIFYHPLSRRRAVLPRHNRDMPKGTLIALLKEAGFTQDEFLRFLEGM